jgi:hypothetical protein
MCHSCGSRNPGLFLRKQESRFIPAEAGIQVYSCGSRNPGLFLRKQESRFIPAEAGIQVYSCGSRNPGNMRFFLLSGFPLARE